MKMLESPWQDPYLNLALEEVIFDECRDDEYLLLWQNESSLIIGKHQNVFGEVNQRAAEQEMVPVIRRMTGGGTVYHDLGNVNFSFFYNCTPEEDASYQRFLRPIQRMLESLGVHAIQNSRNDMEVMGKKVSGNAQLIRGDRILHHGTLLFNTDLYKMERLLQVPAEKLESKGIASVKSRVGNLKDYVWNPKMPLEEFQAYIREFMMARGAEKCFPAQSVLDAAEKLADEKYRTYEWNYGQSPEFTITRSRRFACGQIEVGLCVENGRITKCQIMGDYLGRKPVEELEKGLTGLLYKKDVIEETLRTFDLEAYLGKITVDELMHCFW
ncbi:MAG: lipoate--protein ligase [Lachnospiraceae bacterium]|jgi:lipoate-protein ligase A